MSELTDLLNANAILVIVVVQILTLIVGLIRFIVELKNERYGIDCSECQFRRNNDHWIASGNNAERNRD